MRVWVRATPSHEPPAPPSAARCSTCSALLAIVAAVQFVYCFAMGLEDANDISYRQAIAPDEIQGRMNATIRTVNRIVFFVGALVTGALMTLLGLQPTLGIGALIFAGAAAVVLLSPLRRARHEEVAS